MDTMFLVHNRHRDGLATFLAKVLSNLTVRLFV